MKIGGLVAKSSVSNWGLVQCPKGQVTMIGTRTMLFFAGKKMALKDTVVVVPGFAGHCSLTGRRVMLKQMNVSLIGNFLATSERGHCGEL